MSVTAILLILLSAFLHAGWNLISKREQPTVSFFILANFMGCLLFFPIAVKYWHIYYAFYTQVWIYIATTGIFLAVYFAALAKMLQTGDLSISYPLLRSSPVVLVVIISFLIGQASEISYQCIGGILLVVIGCFIMPMLRFGDFRIQNYINPTSGYALLAAIGSVGYSMIDDHTLRILRTLNSAELNNLNLTLLYAFSEAVSTTIWLLLFILIKRKRHLEFFSAIRNRKRKAALTGIIIYLTYTLVLISMASVKNVSYVVALRQFSIPLGALAGVYILGESRQKPKFVGIGVLLIGLFLVSTG